MSRPGAAVMRLPWARRMEASPRSSAFRGACSCQSAELPQCSRGPGGLASAGERLNGGDQSAEAPGRSAGEPNPRGWRAWVASSDMYMPTSPLTRFSARSARPLDDIPDARGVSTASSPPPAAIQAKSTLHGKGRPLLGKASYEF